MKPDINNTVIMTNFLDNYSEVVCSHFTDLNRMFSDRVDSLNQFYKERLNSIEEYKKILLVEAGSGKLNGNALGFSTSFSSKRKYNYCDEDVPNKRNSIRRSTRKCNIPVISEGDCLIMPPPPAPAVRSTRTRARATKSTISQTLTAIDSDSDGESGTTSRQRTTRASKQSNNTSSVQSEDNSANEKSNDKSSVMYIKPEIDDSEIMPPPSIVNTVKNKPAKLGRTRKSSDPNRNDATASSLDITDQDTKNIENDIELNKTNEIEPPQVEARAKRTKAKKRDTETNQNNIEVNKTDNSEFSQTEARPKRTKAKKRTLQESQNESTTHSKTSNRDTDEVDLKQVNLLEVNSLMSEITSDKQQEANETKVRENSEKALQSESEVHQEQRPKRTKARKLQKQQALDATLPKESSAEMLIKVELTVQSSNDDNTYSDTTSRPKRTRKVNKKYEAHQREESNQDEETTSKSAKNENSDEAPATLPEKKNDNLVSDASADDKFYDAQSKDSEIDPSFASLPSATTSDKRQFNATVVLDKPSKIVFVTSSNESEQHPNDKTFNVEILQIDSKIRPALNETIVLSSHTNDKNAPAMNQTVVLKKEQEVNCDSSLLTDDNSEVEETPPKPFSHNSKKNPTKHSKTITKLCGSPVKQRVEQFERMAATNKAAAECIISSAGTRNKAKAKDSAIEVPNSAKVTRSNIETNVESFLHHSGSKAAAITSVAGEEAKRRYDREEEALKKKNALIEAKRLEQKIMREKRAAAAAASRTAAAKEREQAKEAARLKQEKINLATAQRSEQRYQTNNKKRQDQERKAFETEERRKQEEEARQAKVRELELENQRAAEEKRKQHEEYERRRKEALAEEKKMQLARQEFLAKKKEEKRLLALQSKAKSKPNTPLKGIPGFANTPLKGMSTSTMKSTMTATALSDGFEYLDPNDSENRLKREVPQWSRSEHRNKVLYVQRYIDSSAIDTLFMVQRFNPKLEEIFPAIDKNLLKRSSSAVWKTPPRYSMMPNIY